MGVGLAVSAEIDEPKKIEVVFGHAHLTSRAILVLQTFLTDILPVGLAEPAGALVVVETLHAHAVAGATKTILAIAVIGAPRTSPRLLIAFEGVRAIRILLAFHAPRPLVDTDISSRALGIVDAAHTEVLLLVAKRRKRPGAIVIIAAFHALMVQADQSPIAIQGRQAVAADGIIAGAVADPVGAMAIILTGQAMAVKGIADPGSALSVVLAGIDADLIVAIADLVQGGAFTVIGAIHRPRDGVFTAAVPRGVIGAGIEPAPIAGPTVSGPRIEATAVARTGLVGRRNLVDIAPGAARQHHQYRCQQDQQAAPPAR